MTENEQEAHGAWWKWMVWGCLFYLVIGVAFAGAVPEAPVDSPKVPGTLN